MQDARPERRKIVDNRVPHSFDIHPVIAMPEPVAEAADIVPRQAGAQTLRILSEPHRRLADEQDFALDRGNRFRVPTEHLQIHVTRELKDHVDGVEDISQG